MVEQELADTNETLSDQTCQNQAVQASKMKIESEMATLSSDLDEMAAEAGLSGNNLILAVSHCIVGIHYWLQLACIQY